MHLESKVIRETHSVRKIVVKQIIFFYFEKCDAVGQKMFTYGTFKTSSGIKVLAF
jgi:hypothetical protein